MQPSADTTAANHQLRSTDPKADKTTVSYSHSPSNNGTLQSTVPKRPSGDGEYHQRSHSAAMGPMGANENHGPVRGKPGQSPSRNMEGSHDERANILVNGNHDSLHARSNSNGMDMGEDDEHDEDDDMDGQERDPNETDEENVDELMDEADYEDGEGSESMDGNEKGDHSWDKGLPRQGGPRNNRPLQVRPTTSAEAGGLSSAEYSESGSSHLNGEGSNGADSTHVGPANSVSVNNGSSKKRTTPAKHKCPQCDKYFTRPFNLKSHQRTHTQERPFVCSFSHCARAFSRLHDCNRHMRTHWRIKPYSCPECHRNFVRQDALTRHLRLDFGHNRCTGFPGPSPGTAANQEKAEDSADGSKSEPSGEGSSHPHSAPAKLEGGSAASKAGPSYKSSTSPTSPTHPSSTGHGAPRSEPLDRDSERPVGPMLAARDPRVPQKPIQTTDLTLPKAEPVEEREQLSRRDPGVHGRYQGVSMAPMSFVHRSNQSERRAITPPEMKEGSSYPQHTRSFSHSSFNQSQSSGPVNGPSSAHPPGSERRSATTAPRNGAPWSAQGHDPASSEYYHGPHARPPPPGHIVTRQEPYGNEYDRQRPPTSAHSDYPPSPHEARRSPPPHHGPDWNGPERSWTWSSQDSRHRSSWSSVSGRGSGTVPHPQEQGHHPSPIRSSTMDSWPRGPHSREGREDAGREPREGPGPIRIPPRSSTGYPSSPYSAEPGPEGHSRTPSGAYRRSEDRVRGPSGYERRPPHEMDMGMDIRPRYEHHPNSPQDARDYPSVHRLSVIDGPPLSPELPHGYSERGYPSYHEREGSRDISRDGVTLGSASSVKDPAGRDPRPTRTTSSMDYESERDYHRQQRYTGAESKRETRGSMSPVPPHRHGMEGGRPYEGNPNYPYSSERPEQYTREEMERMSATRTFRNEDRMVMSPLPREDQGGYFGESNRPSSYRSSQGYSAPPQRAPESPHHYPDAPHESARRERHSMDVPMTPTPTVVGPPPPKRPLTAATVATR